jgi:hypothetical protein
LADTAETAAAVHGELGARLHHCRRLLGVSYWLIGERLVDRLLNVATYLGHLVGDILTLHDTLHGSRDRLRTRSVMEGVERCGHGSKCQAIGVAKRDGGFNGRPLHAGLELIVGAVADIAALAEL